MGCAPLCLHGNVAASETYPLLDASDHLATLVGIITFDAEGTRSKKGGRCPSFKLPSTLIPASGIMGGQRCKK
jgi:hypothetical protein